MDKYNATPVAAQAFLAVNLVGFLVAAPLASWLRRRWSPARVIVVGALLDAALLALLSAPIGLAWTISIRALEGLPDALVFGELFALVGAVEDPRLRVRRYGVASTTLMLSIGLGIVAGGAMARGTDPTNVYWFGAMANIAAAVFVRSLAATALPQRDIPLEPAESPAASTTSVPRPLWPALVMAFADRATGGSLTSVLPLLLGRILGADAGERGWMVGLPVILMALGAGLAAMVAARAGVRVTRHAGAAIYALALIAIAVVPPERPLLVVLLVVAGCAGSVLLPTSLAIAARSRRGCTALTAFAAAGGVGQSVGLLVPLLLFAGIQPGTDGERGLLAGFGCLHLASTVVTSGASWVGAWRQRSVA